MCQDEPSSRHLGTAGPLGNIKTKYYWPRLTSDVTHYVRSCRDCQRRKTPPKRPAGLLQPIAVQSRPFQKIGMDLLCPFPTSRAEKKWIVVATEYALRRGRRSQEGDSTRSRKFFIHQLVLRNVAPEVLITHRGTAFTGELMQGVLRYNTDHRRTTAYHTQTNGLTERLNKTIAGMLSMYVDVGRKTCDEVLHYVPFACSRATQETTQMTPFQLVYERRPTTMLDAVLPHANLNADDDLNTEVQAYPQRA